MNLASTTTTLSQLKTLFEIRDNWSEVLDVELKFDDKEETLIFFYEKYSTLFAIIQKKETKTIIALLNVLVHGVWATWDHLFDFNSHNMDEIQNWSYGQLEELINLAKEFENSDQEFKHFLNFTRPDLSFVLDDTSDCLQKLLDTITEAKLEI